MVARDPFAPLALPDHLTVLPQGPSVAVVERLLVAVDVQLAEPADRTLPGLHRRLRLAVDAGMGGVPVVHPPRQLLVVRGPSPRRLGPRTPAPPGPHHGAVAFDPPRPRQHILRPAPPPRRGHGRGGRLER